MSENAKAGQDTAQQNPPAGITELLNRLNPAILISVAVGATLVALVAVISMVMLLSLSNDVAHLEDQMRKAGKMIKTMEQELTEIRSTLAARPPVAEDKTGPAPAKVTHIDTTDPTSDCVVRSGSKGGLADCFK